MKLFFTFIFLLSLFLRTDAQEVLRRTLNNGNLVLEDIPEIPQTIVAALNRYQNVRFAPLLDWTLDGKSLLIATRFGDVSQIHRVDHPGGARHQLTFFAEPVGSVLRREGSEELAFTMDSGGSEFSQIYLLDSKTGESRLLTDGKSRNEGIKWSRDGSRLAYRSTRRNGRSNDIWMMEPEKPEQARIILESKDGSSWGPGQWSDDGTKLLVSQYISARDSRIHLLSLDSLDLALVEGAADHPSVNYIVGYDQSGNGIFFITNQVSEFNQLAYRKLDEKTSKILTPDLQWNVESARLSPSNDRLAFTVNEDGLDTLYLLDTATFAFQKVDRLPVGLIGGLRFSPDGKRLGLTLNTARSPSDSFTLDLGEKPLDTNNLTRWTYSEVGGLDTTKFSEPELIRYSTFDQRKIPAFFYRPQSTATGDKKSFPVIIYIHGGPEGQFQPSFSSRIQSWIDILGAAVIAPNVRGSSGYGKEYLDLDNGFKREDSVKDIGALLDWIATQPDLDAGRVAVYGGSYGGYMVLASSVYYSDRLKAAVDLVGISNFVTFLNNTQDYRKDLRRVEYGDERDPKMREFLEKISPSNQVDKINVPMLVIQGQNDPRVPVTEAVQIVEGLRKNGKAVWYLNALNEGHGYSKKENRDISEQIVIQFLQKFLLQ